jgi:hypothetical protein
MIPRDCAKFAKTIMNQVQGQLSGGGSGSDEQIQRITIQILMEFFANGIIENEYIYRELMLGKVKDIKEIEALGQIIVNWD